MNNKYSIYICFLILSIIIYLSSLPNVLYFIVIVLIIFYSIYLINKKDVKSTKSIIKLKSKLNKIEKKVFLAQENFANLSNSLEDGIMIINADGVVDYVNDSMNHILVVDNIINSKYKSIKTEPNVINYFDDTWVSEKDISKTICINSSFYNFKSTTFFSNDFYVGSIIIASDITEIKKVSQFQKDFIADASHELKTPVSSILMASEILARDAKLEPKMKQFNNIVVKESNRMKRIVDDLLSISKYEQLDFKLNKEYIYLDKLVDEAFSVFHSNSKNIELINNTTDLFINIDLQRFKEVLINLISNSLAYTDAGYIKITSHLVDNFVYIIIEDTGVGISEENLPNIFKRFYRVDPSRSKGSGGTGLGLSIVKKTIEAHGGEIWVSSILGKGTKFEIKINYI